MGSLHHGNHAPASRARDSQHTRSSNHNQGGEQVSLDTSPKHARIIPNTGDILTRPRRRRPPQPGTPTRPIVWEGRMAGLVLDARLLGPLLRIHAGVSPLC